jgi:outer membrane receptor for ferric coprogen and ferric-rhodotorulic acid
MNGYAGFTKLSWFEGNEISQTSYADKVKRIQLELGYQQALFEGLFKVSGAVYQDTFNNDSNTDTALKTSWEYRF